jgi:hypothetical protein
VKSSRVDDSVPVSGIGAVEHCVTSATLSVIVPEIGGATGTLSWPTVPLADAQWPDRVAPLCVRSAVTVSVTVTPAVTNCHVPLQLPVRDVSLVVGAEGELPHADAKITAKATATARGTRFNTITA